MRYKLKTNERGDEIKADLVSRANYQNGKYKVLNFELNDLFSTHDIFYLETLQAKANLVDKIITEIEKEGKDISDPEVIMGLEVKLSAIGEPVHRGEPIITVIFVSIQLITYYGIAMSIWGVAIKQSFLGFALGGIIVGLLISILFVAPVIGFQRTRIRIREVTFVAGSLWGNFAIIIGIVGFVVWGVRLFFFG